MGDKLHNWLRMVHMLLNINLQLGRDTFTWFLQANGCFMVHSMYKNLVNSGVKVSQEIWKAKIPLKIKIFMWYLKRGVLLTKDNLARRNWIGSKVCSFCNQEEKKVSNTFFFDCAYAKLFWHAIHLVFGLAPPKNVDGLFNH